MARRSTPSSSIASDVASGPPCDARPRNVRHGEATALERFAIRDEAASAEKSALHASAWAAEEDEERAAAEVAAPERADDRDEAVAGHQRRRDEQRRPGYVAFAARRRFFTSSAPLRDIFESIHSVSGAAT